jgi:hypothetical protein
MSIFSPAGNISKPLHDLEGTSCETTPKDDQSQPKEDNAPSGDVRHPDHGSTLPTSPG